MDVYDRLQAGDLMQASAIIASFVYNTANRSEMLPRKPLPKPGEGGSGGGNRNRQSTDSAAPGARPTGGSR
jgi:hypothetical protein